MLALCQRSGLVKLGHVSLDGTKVRANASKHKAMSYGRMREKHAQLSVEVSELLREAQEVDEEEDRRYGRDRRGDELPAELAFREGRMEKIREAMTALEAEALSEAEQADAEGREHGGVLDDSSQRNFTDAESRLMPAPGGREFVHAYNCQAVVDAAHQVIVAARATNQVTDKRQAAPMVGEAIINAGAVPGEVSADAGYYSKEAVKELYALGVDPYIAPDQTRHGRVVPDAPGTYTRSPVAPSTPVNSHSSDRLLGMELASGFFDDFNQEELPRVLSSLQLEAVHKASERDLEQQRLSEENERLRELVDDLQERERKRREFVARQRSQQRSRRGRQ